MKSLIFSVPMVLALLAGRKTQTRRVVKPQPKWVYGQSVPVKTNDADPDGAINCPHRVGDTLYVRETWRPMYERGLISVTYCADGALKIFERAGDTIAKPWFMPTAAKRGNVSPLLMPAWASRLHWTITDVRVQRVQDISPCDADREGYLIGTEPCCLTTAANNRIGWYRQIWSDLHGPESWDANHWVWAYTFEVKKIGGA